MAVIEDVKKLKPELLELSPAEIDRRIAELQMAKDEIKKKEDAEFRAFQAEHAGEHIDKILAGLRFLHENDFLAENVIKFFTTEKGQFMPHLKLKKPRA
jgi:hypothetical protein